MRQARTKSQGADPVPGLTIPECPASRRPNGSRSSDRDALGVNMAVLLLDINHEQIEGATDGSPVVAHDIQSKSGWTAGIQVVAASFKRGLR